MEKYNHKEIEAKWQKRWEEEWLFSPREDTPGRKMYVLDMFPYPSGDGLHVGHVKIYTASDVVSRYLRMKGMNVLHPTGWDAFGLPTENTAIEKKIHPAELTKQNIDHFRRQMKSVGYSYDWSREISTTDPNYYKWTQWIFIQLFKMGLAYEDTVPINWCPSCKTGLANEEVEGGKCERCGTIVENKPIRQWMLRITKYADRLLQRLDGLDWPEFILDMQRNWIGRSEGVNFKERVKDLGIEFEVYDSIPQTFIAQTFTVIAPEHPMVEELVKGTKYEAEVAEFVEHIKRKKLDGSFDAEKDLEGVFTGRYVDNPFGTGDLPIWVASYVLADYGTGIVNCSAHDERDWAFAKKFGIPLKVVLLPADGEQAKRVQDGEEFYRESEGLMQEPAEFKGMTWEEARQPVIDYIVKKSLGRRAVNYKLRDWVFSRQRYWGEPIPIIHCSNCGAVPVPEDQLPVELPAVDNYEPTGTGESPLAAVEEWIKAKCPNCPKIGRRETNTMPQWAGSSWYWLRYLDVKNADEIASREEMDEWLPVDLYVGGAEHAVLHLLYARFWNMALYDQGIVGQEEPFKRFRSVGLLLGDDGQKMSKSRGNVVNPDVVIEKVGADALRTYVMFMGPFGHAMSWSDASLNGVARFLNRVWQGVTDKIQNVASSDSEDMNYMLHKTIKRVAEGTEQFRFNTAVAALMELLNAIEKEQNVSRTTLESFILMLSPYAPHVCEELWEKLGHGQSIVTRSWPEYDPTVLVQRSAKIPVQVNGKVRGEVEVVAGSSKEVAEGAALGVANVNRYLEGKEVVKVVYVEGKTLNFVVK